MKPEEAEAYGFFGPGHYSYEIVADVPVHFDRGCRPGRLVDWFGRYDKKQGLAAALWVKRVDDADDFDEFELKATRKTVAVTDPYLSDAPAP